MKLHEELTPAEQGHRWEEGQNWQPPVRPERERRRGGRIVIVEGSPSSDGADGSVFLAFALSVFGVLSLAGAGVIRDGVTGLMAFCGLWYIGYHLKKIIQIALGLLAVGAFLTVAYFIFVVVHGFLKG